MQILKDGFSPASLQVWDYEVNSELVSMGSEHLSINTENRRKFFFSEPHTYDCLGDYAVSLDHSADGRLPRNPVEEDSRVLADVVYFYEMGIRSN